MSIALPSVSLVGASVGTTGKVSLANTGISAGAVSANPSFTLNKASLFIFNDSGCGLMWVSKNGGSSFNTPAGAWVIVPLSPGESELDFSVVYTLPNPPVSLILLTYYAPGEALPSGATLGNSPIGGGVSTSSIQTLSNEGNPVGTEVIDIGTPTTAKLIDIFNNHFVWSVEQATVAHQVLKGQTAGNPLQIGQAGDVTEVLGQLTLDQLATFLIGPAINPTSVHVVGGTSGTADLYQILSGTIKLVVVSVTSFQTGASNQNLAIPTPFTKYVQFWTGDMSNFSLLKATVAQSINVYTAFAAAGGSSSPVTVVHLVSQGDCPQAIDTVQYVSGGAAQHNGLLVLLGQ